MNLWSLARVFSLRNVTFQARNCCHPRAQAPRRHGVLLQCVAACCSVSQCVAVCWSVRLRLLSNSRPGTLAAQCAAAVCCSVFQWVAVRCSALQCPKLLSSSRPGSPATRCAVAVCCNMLQCLLRTVAQYLFDTRVLQMRYARGPQREQA